MTAIGDEVDGDEVGSELSHSAPALLDPSGGPSPIRRPNSGHASFDNEAATFGVAYPPPGTSLRGRALGGAHPFRPPAVLMEWRRSRRGDRRLLSTAGLRQTWSLSRLVSSTSATREAWISLTRSFELVRTATVRTSFSPAGGRGDFNAA